MASVDDEFERLLHDGINAAKSNERRLAQSLLYQASRINAQDARPWIWLAETTANPDEKQEFLEMAVLVDPTNQFARRSLALLTGELDAEEVLPEGQEVLPPPASEPEKAETAAVFLCPNCGAHLVFDVHIDDLACPNCGTTWQAEKQPASRKNGQPLDFVLPTRRGHLWAVTQHHLNCERCGARSLWPVGQLAGACPYCGSNLLIESPQTRSLIDPHATGLMKFDEEQAVAYFRQWLGKGLVIPDDLAQFTRSSRFRPAYYSFWLFDGTLEARWTCEINEGTVHHQHWIPRSGVEYELFNNILVPGLRSLTEKEIESVSPFDLKALLEFRPELVAGWPVLTYNISLADATLQARQRVLQQVRDDLHTRVEPGKEKRNLQTGSSNWSDITFKHLLLPLWVGNYTYQGHSYQVLINGQTGKVAGKKPLDAVKVGLLAIGSVFVLFILSILAILLSTGK